MRAVRAAFLYCALIIVVMCIGEACSGWAEYVRFLRKGTRFNLFYKVPFLAHRVRPGFERDYEKGRVKVNSLGFRGKEFSVKKPYGVFRIICIGESTTFGVGCSSNGTTYPALLEKKLNAALGESGATIEVINAGIPSYSSLQCLTFQGLECMPLEPDLIIIYTGWNEMGEGICKGWNSDYRYGFRVSPFKERQVSFMQFSGLEDYLHNSFFLKRLTKIAEKSRKAFGRIVPSLAKEPPPRLPEYEAGSEVNTRALGVWENNLRNMAAMAKGRGCRVLFFSWPQLLNVGESAAESGALSLPLGKGGTPYQSAGAAPIQGVIMRDEGFRKLWMLSYVRYQERLQKLAREEKVFFYDAASRYKGIDNVPLYYDEIHLTDQGNEVLAKGLSDFIDKTLGAEIATGE